MDHEDFYKELDKTQKRVRELASKGIEGLDLNDLFILRAFLYTFRKYPEEIVSHERLEMQNLADELGGLFLANQISNEINYRLEDRFERIEEKERAANVYTNHDEIMAGLKELSFQTNIIEDTLSILEKQREEAVLFTLNSSYLLLYVTSLLKTESALEYSLKNIPATPKRTAEDISKAIYDRCFNFNDLMDKETSDSMKEYVKRTFYESLKKFNVQSIAWNTVSLSKYLKDKRYIMFADVHPGLYSLEEIESTIKDIKNTTPLEKEKKAEILDHIFPPYDYTPISKERIAKAEKKVEELDHLNDKRSFRLEKYYSAILEILSKEVSH